MITYKPSSRLGLLNEEDFTTDPTSRGWTITGDNYSFGVDGLTMDFYDMNYTKFTTLQNTSTSWKKYLQFKISGSIDTSYASVSITVSVYANNVFAGSITGAIPAYGNFIGNFNIFINNPHDFKLSGTTCSYDNNNDNATCGSNFGTTDVNQSNITNIKIVIRSETNNYDRDRYFHLTGLKWV